MGCWVKDKAAEVAGGTPMQGHSQDLGFYLESHGKPLRGSQKHDGHPPPRGECIQGGGKWTGELRGKVTASYRLEKMMD